MPDEFTQFYGIVKQSPNPDLGKPGTDRCEDFPNDEIS